MNFKKIFSSFFYLSLPYPILFLVTFISLPIVLKSVSKEHYGLFFFTLAIGDWLSAATGVNIFTGMKRGVANKQEGTFMFVFFKRVRLILLIGFLLIFVGISLNIFYKKELLGSLLLIAPLSIFSYGLFRPILIEYLVAKQEFRKLAFWKILMYTLPYIVSTAVVFFVRNIVLFAMLQLGILMLICVLGFLYLIRKYNLISAYKKGLIDSNCYPYGLKLIPVDLVSVTAFKLSTFLIGPFVSFSELAVFSVANNLRDRTSEFIKNIRSFLYADFAKLSQESLLKKVRKKSAFLIIASFAISSLIAMGGVVYIKFVLPLTYHHAIFYFLILSFSFPASILDIVLMTMLEAHLRHKELIIRKLIPDILKIIIILVFGYFWKTTGICIGVTLSMWLALGICYFVTFKGLFSQRVLL